MEVLLTWGEISMGILQQQKVVQLILLSIKEAQLISLEMDKLILGLQQQQLMAQSPCPQKTQKMHHLEI